MMVFVLLAVAFFAAVGVVMIVRREEIAAGLAYSIGATTQPGCSVMLGIVSLVIAVAAVVLFRAGLFGGG